MAKLIKRTITEEFIDPENPDERDEDEVEEHEEPEEEGESVPRRTQVRRRR